MKNILIYTIIISIFSFNSFAQKTKVSRIDEKIGSSPKDPDSLIEAKSGSTLTIKSYRVEEKINSRFGGSTIIYEVTDLKLINNNDLGPNNTRVITPLYKDEEQPSNKHKSNRNKIEPININLTTQKLTEVKVPIQNQLKIDIKELLDQYDTQKTSDNSKITKKYVYIHLIKTYEKIAAKGYKSIEIFQKLGDTYFFDEQYSKAAKWYRELFEMTTNLEPEYYDHYIHSLTVIGEKEKANEIKKKRQELFGAN
ncbi:MAG TPA: hypothetical protein VIV55_03330 [Flavobacterium sp.]